MSTVIPLRFKSNYDPDLLSEGIKFNLMRLLADVDFKLRAFLLETDAAPFILGFEDFLTASILTSNYPNKKASLKF